MKRKLFSALLALAMMAALALPAFADGTGSGGAVDKPMEYDASTDVPIVTVEMPSSPKVILNPYGMTVNIDSTQYSTQIVSPVYYIKNETQAPMKVGVKATATPGGKAVLATKPCTGKEAVPTAFVMVELTQCKSTAATGTDAATWTIDEALSSDKINEKCYPQIIPTAEGKTNAAILSVDKPTITDGTLAPNYIAVKVTGNLAGNPTDAWTTADKVDLKLEFTFTPGVANTVTVPSGITASKPSAVMGSIVRLTTAADAKQPVVTDGATNTVTVNKVSDTLYYFVMPATAVTVTAGT